MRSSLLGCIPSQLRRIGQAVFRHALLRIFLAMSLACAISGGSTLTNPAANLKGISSPTLASPLFSSFALFNALARVLRGRGYREVHSRRASSLRSRAALRVSKLDREGLKHRCIWVILSEAADAQISRSQQHYSSIGRFRERKNRKGRSSKTKGPFNEERSPALGTCLHVTKCVIEALHFADVHDWITQYLP